MENSQPIRCSLWRWWTICRELKRRGYGVRESGAFLLGREVSGGKQITSAVYYDDIDPGALATGIVRLNGGAFAKLWQICRDRDLEVVADVHTHPCAAFQSQSDQQHPMISMPGHVALILPCFAQHPLSLATVGVYQYRGSKQWSSCPAPSLRWLTIHI